MIRKLLEFLPRPLRDAAREASLVRKAAARNKGFHCAALAGESDYNICINSDLTVSCNCQDFDGSGRIGDLNKESLPEIFAGPTVAKWRAMLAARRLPLKSCLHCAELRLVPSAEVDALVPVRRVPEQGIMLENTALCNLRCGMCDREKLLSLRSGKAVLSLEGVERVAVLLRQYGVRKLSFFNLGEPFLPDDVLEQVRTIRRYNPGIKIMTSTNGQLLDRKGRIEAALLMDYIWVSLAGVTDDMVHRYQVGGAFEQAYRNMEALVAERDRRGQRTPVVEWKYVMFRWNDRRADLDRAVELARGAKIDVMGFYRGDGPLLHRSLRWYDPSFKSLGDKKGDGVVINLNEVAPDLFP